MIVIKNRELLIPNNEQFIGTVYDNNADTRFFKIDRVLPGQIDLNNFTFVADVVYSFDGVEDYSSSETYAVGDFCKYSGHYYRCTTAITVAEAWNAAHWTVCSETDSLSLTKDSVTDDSIVLRMSLPASVFTGHVGNMAIQVRCSDTAGRTWSTAPANMYIMDQISNPGAVTSSTTLTELQQTETTIEASEALRIAAETSRANAETGRVNAESARVLAESGRATAETGRVNAESGRASAETNRANEETARGNAETGRSTAESGRVNAETGRVNAESARVLAETARETAEANREATLATKSLISEGYAKGTQNDVPVTSESTYYHNNSKYYSEESASKASTADAKRLVSEGFANGQQNGVDVGAGSPYYHNNAKYFMEQAGSASGFVSYAVDQQLPDGAKQIARNNIDSYKKPSSGIPSSDMASAVQTSLGKADSAYQKPATGIPSTDMTSAVQTSLGKADTALQEHQSLSAYRTSSAQDVIDAGKAAAVHTHDDRYYTESEADSLFEDKADRADVHPLINIWDEQWEFGYYNSDGSTIASNSYIRSKSTNFISISPNTEYYYKSANALVIQYYDANKSIISQHNNIQNVVRTSPSNAYYLRFYIDVELSTYSYNVSINYPSTYHGYYPSALPKTNAHVGGLGNVIGMRGWNQLIPNTTEVITGWEAFRVESIVVGHKYIFFNKVSRRSEGSTDYQVYCEGASGTVYEIQGAGFVFTASTTQFDWKVAVYDQFVSPVTINANLIDLTALFGAGNEPSSVEDFRAMFPSEYYPYCSGSFGDLLWENASPSSAFPATSYPHIQLDLSKYSSVLIVTSHHSSSSPELYTHNDLIVKGESSASIFWTHPGWLYYVCREVSVSSNSISFSNGKNMQYSSNSWVDTDTVCIPYQIYGVR